MTSLTPNAARPPTLLLFGASGAIGSEIAAFFQARAWRVVRVSRSTQTHAAVQSRPQIHWDIAASQDPTQFAQYAPYDAVCWAQGANLNDSCYGFDRAAHLALYDANCLSVVQTLEMLLKHDALAKPARLSVISSIWQERSRQNKLSYSMTKAALRGLVLSAAADLAKDGHLINAVLPGVLETPMTRANLEPSQLRRVEEATQFNTLPEVHDVAYAVWSLSQPENHGITGQFIKVDRGFSDIRII